MNQTEEEKKLRALFRELRRADERLSPPFARDWGRALSRLDKARSRRRLIQLATVAVMLILAVGPTVLSFLKGNSQSAMPFSHTSRDIAPDNAGRVQVVWFDQRDDSPRVYYTRGLP